MANLVIEQLKRHEGFRKHVYKCTAGHDTVGFGYNLDANPLALTPYEIKETSRIQSGKRVEDTRYGFDKVG